MTKVCLTSVEIEDARALATTTFEKYKQNRGHYNNTLKSHLKGKLGEIAVEKHLQQNYENVAIQSIFRDPQRDSECDLQFGIQRIEVKTWSKAFWDEMGRCVAVGQLPKLKTKADLVIWCVGDLVDDQNCLIELAGWNTIQEITNAPRRWTGPDWGRKVDNYQMDLELITKIDLLGAFV